jgi:hypothetical protein
VYRSSWGYKYYGTANSSGDFFAEKELMPDTYTGSGYKGPYR